MFSLCDDMGALVTLTLNDRLGQWVKHRWMPSSVGVHMKAGGRYNKHFTSSLVICQCRRWVQIPLVGFCTGESFGDTLSCNNMCSVLCLHCIFPRRWWWRPGIYCGQPTTTAMMTGVRFITSARVTLRKWYLWDDHNEDFSR